MDDLNRKGPGGGVVGRKCTWRLGEVYRRKDLCSSTQLSSLPRVRPIRRLPSILLHIGSLQCDELCTSPLWNPGSLCQDQGSQICFTLCPSPYLPSSPTEQLYLSKPGGYEGESRASQVLLWDLHMTHCGSWDNFLPFSDLISICLLKMGYMISKDPLGYHDNKLSQRLVLKQLRECPGGSELSITSAGEAAQSAGCWM